MSKDEKLKRLSILKIASPMLTNQNVPTVRTSSAGTDNETNLFRYVQPSASMKMKMEQINEAASSLSKK